MSDDLIFPSDSIGNERNQRKLIRNLRDEVNILKSVIPGVVEQDWKFLGGYKLEEASNSITVGNFAEMNFLKIVAYCFPSGGTISLRLRFNGDSGSNYAWRMSINGGVDSVNTATSLNDSGTIANVQMVSCEIVNVANAEKLGYVEQTNAGAVGVANAPNRREGSVKWGNLSARISSATVFNSGTGLYAPLSRLYVWGRD